MSFHTSDDSINMCTWRKQLSTMGKFENLLQLHDKILIAAHLSLGGCIYVFLPFYAFYFMMIK